MRPIDADILIHTIHEEWDEVLVVDESGATIANEFERLVDSAPTIGEWIPCSERLPKDLEPVNITWVNHNPVSYYADIKDKPFTATGHYCNGRWWWYSATCEDYLSEFGRSGDDEMDDDIEVIAWMPLPKPWREEQ